MRTTGRHAFNRIRLKESIEDLTTFRTCYGSYKYRVLPFGFCNGPASFQRFINSTLFDYLDLFCTVYVDDILIFSDDPPAHEEHVKKVLERLRQAGLQVDIKKSAFSVKSSTFLLAPMYSNALLPAVASLSVLLVAASLSPLQRSAPSSPTLPPSSLPPPPNGTVLKYIALGLGTQNDTCASPSSTDAPASKVQKHYSTISSQQLPCAPENHSLLDFFPLRGEHFFSSTGQPTFDLYVVGAQLQAKKVSDVPAPADACPGLDNTGAVRSRLAVPRRC
jgi:Reverse transcriptase (RNA-dependent DNA polymerase)/Protein of unknown function (DUF3455)